MSRARTFLNFVKLLRAEPYIFAYFFCDSIKSGVLVTLFQDKICASKMQLPREFCLNISNERGANAEAVLKLASEYNLYTLLLSNLPSILLLFYIGSWVDNYKNAWRWILQISAFMGVLESSFLALNAYYFQLPSWVILLSFIPSSLTGGYAAKTTTVFAHATTETPIHLRTIRFATLELSLLGGMCLGGFFSGNLITTTPIGDQLHNLSTIFLITVVFQVFSLLWISLISDPTKVPAEEESVNQHTEEVSVNQDTQEASETSTPSKNCCSTIASLFDVQKVVETSKTCLVKRSNYGRIKLWLLIISYAINIANFTAPSIIIQPFTEKAYHWQPEKLNYVNSLTTLIITTVMGVSVPLLMRVFKLDNTALGVLGCTSLIAGNIIRGAILMEQAYYVSVVVSSLSGVTPIAVKAIASGLVHPSEVGRLFTFFSVAEVVVNMVLSPMVTAIFTISISVYTGLVYHFSALTMFCPLITFTILEFMGSKELERSPQ